MYVNNNNDCQSEEQVEEEGNLRKITIYQKIIERPQKMLTPACSVATFIHFSTP